MRRRQQLAMLIAATSAMGGLVHAEKASTADSCAISSEAAAVDNPWGWVRHSRGDTPHGCDSGLCNGQYLRPAAQSLNTNEEAPLEASADSSSLEGDLVQLEGKVELRKGDLLLEANSAEYQRDAGDLALKGQVKAQNPEFLFRGDEAQVNINDRSVDIKNAQVLSYASGSRATAKRIHSSGQGSVELEQARYTQCPPDQETWSLQAGHIKLEQERGRGVARNTLLRIADVPVFYIPWMDFPIDDRRASGLLWPIISSSDGGADIALPIYLNLAENYDATLTPRLLNGHGTMLETEARYLDQYGYWVGSAAFLGSDDETGEDRWLMGLQQQGQIGDRWHTRIDYTRVSDIDYFQDLGVNSLAVKRSSYLRQQASTQYRSDNWLGQLNIERHQRLGNVDRAYQKLPELRLDYRGKHHWQGIKPLLSLESSHFDHRDAIADGGSEITGLRHYAEVGLQLPYRKAGLFAVATVKQRSLRYNIDDATASGFSKDPAANSALASLDLGAEFVRTLSGGWMDGWQQTLEPRLYYLYAEEDQHSNAPVFDSYRRRLSYQQLFRENRYAGRDRLADAQQVSIGVSSRFIDTNGEERASFSLGQIQHHDDREVILPGEAIATDNRSSFVAQASVAANDRLWFSGDYAWNEQRSRTEQGHFAAHWQNQDGHRVNLGYSRREDNRFSIEPLEQADVSASLALNKNWQMHTRWQYDLENKRDLEQLVAVEYETCCWSASLVYQQALEPTNSTSATSTERDEAIVLEFKLTGLGGTGNKVQSTLKDSIYGYDD